MKTSTTTLITLIVLTTATLSHAGDKMDPGATKLSEDQLQKKANYYLKWDMNGDQQLASEEYAEMVRTQLANQGKDDYEQEAAKRFARRDLDGNGYVSFAENVISPEDLNAIHKGKSPPKKKAPKVDPKVKSEIEKKAAYFLKWDENNDRQLNEKEFSEMVRVQYEKSGKTGYEAEAAKRFDRNDKDGNGQISFKEHLGK